MLVSRVIMDLILPMFGQVDKFLRILFEIPGILFVRGLPSHKAHKGQLMANCLPQYLASYSQMDQKGTAENTRYLADISTSTVSFNVKYKYKSSIRYVDDQQ